MPLYPADTKWLVKFVLWFNFRPDCRIYCNSPLCNLRTLYIQLYNSRFSGVFPIQPTRHVWHKIKDEDTDDVCRLIKTNNGIMIFGVYKTVLEVRPFLVINKTVTLYSLKVYLAANVTWYASFLLFKSVRKRMLTFLRQICKTSRHGGLSNILLFNHQQAYIKRLG